MKEHRRNSCVSFIAHINIYLIKTFHFFSPNKLSHLLNWIKNDSLLKLETEPFNLMLLFVTGGVAASMGRITVLLRYEILISTSN
ncbi:MAG: hypothetical protein EXX96DRAFT_127187 [Benjaminiella poitrasii]|nr:MAG: hypothetical protein EXX96DRAFT_127187 [Benjaminiella poitrasii]